MILGRVLQNLRKQDWTAVTIELVIVVLGVFIGLQVNDWSAAQAAQRRGHEYVDRLIHDVETDLREQRNLVAYYDAVNESAERANTLLAQPAPDATELVVNAYRATEYAYTPPRRSTWDEVVSSGDIGLLPRPAVESGLSSYYAVDVAVRVLNDLGESPYRRRVRTIISHDVQKAIREGCGDFRDANHDIVGFRQDCRLNVSALEIAQAARALRRDPEVAADLRYQFSEITSAQANLRGVVARLQRGLEGLRQARQ